MPIWVLEPVSAQENWANQDAKLTAIKRSSLMNRFIIATLPLLAATPALAGNIAPAPVEAAPAPVFVAPAPIYSWSGAYIGAQASYADAETDDGVLTDDGDGGLYGLRAGYDYDFGSFVLGGLVSYDYGSVEFDNSGAELENLLRVGARAGLNLGRSLAYASAGYAQAETDVLGDADGYFVGLGYERFLTEKVTFGGEVIYHDFDDLDGAVSTDAKATTVGLNLNYRF